MRRGIFPSFDDIDVERLRSYVSQHEKSIKARLRLAGVPEEYNSLVDAIDKYDAAAREWHAGEPRIPTRILQCLTNLIFSVAGRVR
jgi:hypothetical protein